MPRASGGLSEKWVVGQVVQYLASQSDKVPHRAYIYGLTDTDKPDVIWYIGETTNPKSRIENHANSQAGVNRGLANWTQSLPRERLGMVILRITSYENRLRAEKEEIQKARIKNPHLFNKQTDLPSKDALCHTCKLRPREGKSYCRECRLNYGRRWRAQQ